MGLLSFGKKSLAAVPPVWLGLNRNKKTSSSLNRLEDVESLLALRVANKLVSYVIGNGFTVDFQSEARDKAFVEFANEHNVQTKLMDAIRQSLVMKNGCLVYLVGGLLSEPIVKLETINLINTERVKIASPNEEDVFNPTYHEQQIIAKVTDGDVRIDASRAGIVNLFPGKDSSFMERILPYACIIENIMHKGERLLDLESAIVYRSTRHNTAMTAPAEIMAYQQALLDMKNNMREGNIALMPHKDNIEGFKSSSSIDKVFPHLKEIFSSVVGIPKSILFGEVASGINTGEGKQKDHENFMRDVRGWQEGQLRPIIDKIVSAFLGGRTEEYSVSFCDPLPLSQQETVDIETRHNASITQLVTAGVLADDEARDNLRGVKVDA